MQLLRADGVVWCCTALCGVVSPDPLALVSQPGEVRGYDEEGDIGGQYMYASGVMMDEIHVFRNTPSTPKSPPVPPRPAPRANGDTTPKAVDRAEEPRSRRAQDGHGLIDEDLEEEASTPAVHPAVIQVQGLQINMEVR
jgi:hypothetical protein